MVHGAVSKIYLYFSPYPILSCGAHWLVNIEGWAGMHERCYSVQASSDFQSVELLPLSFRLSMRPDLLN